MKKLFGAILLTLLVITICDVMFAQSKPVMYFCERYDDRQGEIGISSVFYPGYFTIMVKAENNISPTSDVSIQIDKKNSDGTYSFYKIIPFTVKQSNYIYFSDKRLFINDVGTYRVWLIDDRDNVIANSILEIVK